jgi:hypothetical protein
MPDEPEEQEPDASEEPPRWPPAHWPQEQVPGEQALGVETVVVEHDGQWAVDIVVVFPDSVVRRRVSTHRSRRLAELSADYIRRAAEREL